MNWRKVGSMLAAFGIVCLAGCSIFRGGSSPASDAAQAVSDHMGSLKGVNFGILDVIAVLCALGAAGTIVALGFGMPVPPKVTIALVATTIGAWVLKLILVKFLWIIVILFLLALLLCGAVFAYTHLNWIERTLGKDLNKDGKVG